MASRSKLSNRSNRNKELSSSDHGIIQLESTGVRVPLEEVREIIELPEFDATAAKNKVDPESVEIPKNVVQELHGLVSGIASMYRNNPCKYLYQYQEELCVFA